MNDLFDGFTINVYLDDDGDYLAHFAELPTISAFGSSPAKALKELAVAWKATKETYIDQDKEVPVAPSTKSYSGQFNVRVDKRIHKLLVMEAERNGLSLNALVSQKLAKNIEQM